MDWEYSLESGMAPSRRSKQRSAEGRTGRTSNHRGLPVDYEALARFRFELRRFQAFSKAAASKSGLTTQQHQALLAIRGFSSKRPVSVGDLARYLMIRHHTAVELVDRLTRLKVLSRRPDGSDGRRVLLELTKEGERRLQRLSRIHLEEVRAIGPTLARILRPFRRS